MRIRFFNTFQPVTPLYRDVFPALARLGVSVEAVVSGTEYRTTHPPLDHAFSDPLIRIVRTGGGLRRGPVALCRVSIILRYVLDAAIRSLFGPRADMNVFLTQPPLFPLWGVVLKTLRRQPYTIVLMDLYPDLIVRSGLLSERAPPTRVLKWLSAVALRKARRVIVIGRCMQRVVESKGVAPDRIVLIPNWSNHSESYPMDRGASRLRRRLGVESAFVVMYSGNLGVSHTFNDILEVARRCRDDAGIRFVFVGDGSRRIEVERAKAAHGLDNIQLMPIQPVDKLADTLAAADLHFISLAAGFEGLVVPSKTYVALASGRPIVYQGARDSEIALLVHEERVGAAVPPAASDALEHVIRRYMDDPALLREHGERAAAVAFSKYGDEVAIARYVETLTGEVRPIASPATGAPTSMVTAR